MAIPDPVRQAELDVLAAAEAASSKLEDVTFSEDGFTRTHEFMLTMISVINASRHLSAIKAKIPEMVVVDLSAPESSKELIKQLYTCVRALVETAEDGYDGDSVVVTDGLEEIYGLARDLYLQNGGE